MGLLNVGKRIAGFGMRAGMRTGSFMVDHPAPVIAGAAIAGVIAAHPLAGAEQALTGNRHILGQLAAGSALGGAGLGGLAPGLGGVPSGFGANIMTTGNTAGVTTSGSMGISVNPDPDQMLRMSEQVPGTNPSGAILFGLYNNRLR